MFIFFMFFLALGLIGWVSSERLVLGHGTYLAGLEANSDLADEAALALTRVLQCEEQGRVLGSLPDAWPLLVRAPTSNPGLQVRYGDDRTEPLVLPPLGWARSPPSASFHLIDPSEPTWIDSIAAMDAIVLSRLLGPGAGASVLRGSRVDVDDRLAFLYNTWDASTPVPDPFPYPAPRLAFSVSSDPVDLSHLSPSATLASLRTDARFTEAVDPYGRPNSLWGARVALADLGAPHVDSPSRCRSAAPTLVRYAPDGAPRVASVRYERPIAEGVPHLGRVSTHVSVFVRPFDAATSSDEPLPGLVDHVPLAEQPWLHRVVQSRGVPAPRNVAFSSVLVPSGSTTLSALSTWPTVLGGRVDDPDTRDTAQLDGLPLKASAPGDPSFGRATSRVRMIGHVPLIDPVPFALAYASPADEVSAREGAEAALHGLVDNPALAAAVPFTSAFWTRLRWHRDRGGSVTLNTVEEPEVDRRTGVGASVSLCSAVPSAADVRCHPSFRPVARALFADASERSGHHVAPSQQPSAPAQLVAPTFSDYHGFTTSSSVRWVGGYPIITSVDVPVREAPLVVSADPLVIGALRRAVTANAPRFEHGGRWSGSSHRAVSTAIVTTLVGSLGASGPVRGYGLADPGGPCSPAPADLPAAVFCRGLVEAP